MLLLLHEAFDIYAFVLNYEQENVQFDQSDSRQLICIHVITNTMVSIFCIHGRQPENNL